MTILVQYNIMCTGCGIVQGDDWKEGGMQCLREAIDDGWYRGDGHEHLCPYCGKETPGATRLDVVEVRMATGPPPGYSPPMLVCECGTKTQRQKGKCRKCGQELSVEF